MTTREKRLLVVVLVLGLFGVAYGAYQMILKPLQRHRQDQVELLGEISSKSTELEQVMRDLKRLPIAKKRSLPADLDTAKREYESALGYLLRSSGVPAGFTIVPKDSGDTRSVPELAPKKPAYARIGYDIRMQKIDLPTLTKFLEAYYSLNLLHQITYFDIKHVDKDAGSGGIARRGSERADLEVILHTEAIVLDGAENRKSLTAVPMVVAAVAGGGAQWAVMNMPEASRNIKPQQFVPVLSTEPREYLVMEARDVFHGPLPPPKVVAPPPPPVNPFTERPKEDISPFIHLNAITTNFDGVREATIWDKANNHFYEVNVRMNDNIRELKFLKKYRLGEKWKNLEYTGWTPMAAAQPIAFKEEGTATNRQFQFVGFYQDGLILKEQTVADSKEKTAPATDPRRQPVGRPPAGAIKATGEQQVLSATIGGLGMLKPKVVEKIYFWRLGQSLAGIKPLSDAEAKELLEDLAAERDGSPQLASTQRGGSE